VAALGAGRLFGGARHRNAIRLRLWYRVNTQGDRHSKADKEHFAHSNPPDLPWQSIVFVRRAQQEQQCFHLTIRRPDLRYCIGIPPIVEQHRLYQLLHKLSRHRSMLDHIERDLEAARREYDAIEDKLRRVPVFKEFVSRLRFETEIMPPPTLLNNRDFQRWNELAALISNLYRARDEQTTTKQVFKVS
jgi:hypothetical protein